MTLSRLQHVPWRIVSAAAHWHLTSQQQARRNALVATTALMARRQERMDVEDFLVEHTARLDAPATVESVTVPRARGRTA